MYCDWCVWTLRDRRWGYKVMSWNRPDDGKPPLSSRPKFDRVTLPHHFVYSTMKQSADAGCAICYHAWRDLEVRKPTLHAHILRRVAEEVAEGGPRRRGPVRRHRRLQKLPQHATSVTVEVEKRVRVSVRFTEPYPDLPWWPSLSNFTLFEADEGTSRWRLSGPSTSSLATQRICRWWMDDCMANHAACGWTRSSDGWLPTRLISVDGPDRSRVRVVRTAEEGFARGEYVTLSHCWGSRPPLQLTAASQEQLMGGVPLDDLPKTFRHAVDVCRFFAVPYLWIDSMCIAQDNDADWRRESSLMEKVYTGGLLNIAASASRDSTGGLFRARNPGCSPAGGGCEGSGALPVRLTGRNADSRKAEQTLEYHAVSEETWSTRIHHSPLYQRGWVLQERLLSPRVLCFAEDEVFWECRENVASETFNRMCESDIGHSSMSDVDTSDTDSWETHSDKSSSSPRREDSSAAVRSSDDDCSVKFPLSRGPPIAPKQLRVHEHGGFGEDDSFIKARFSQALFRTNWTPSEAPSAGDVASHKSWTAVVQLYTTMDLTKRSDRLVALSGVVKAFASRMGEADSYEAGMWRRSLESELLWFSIRKVGSGDGSREYVAPSFCWGSADWPIIFHSRPARSPGRRFFEILDLQLSHASHDRTGAVTGGHLDLRAPVKPCHVSGFDSGRPKLLWVSEDGKQRRENLLTDRDGEVPAAGGDECMLFFFSAELEDADDDPVTRRRVIVLDVVDANLGIFRRIGHAWAPHPRFPETQANTHWLLYQPSLAGVAVPNRGHEGDMYTIRII